MKNNLNIRTKVLVRQPEGSTMTFWRAISDLYQMIYTCLGLQKNAVSKSGISCRCEFCRPDGPDPLKFIKGPYL